MNFQKKIDNKGEEVENNFSGVEESTGIVYFQRVNRLIS